MDLMAILQVDSPDSLLKYIKLCTNTVGKRKVSKSTSEVIWFDPLGVSRGKTPAIHIL